MDQLSLSLRVADDGTVMDAAYQAQGCVPTLAIAAWLTSHVVGMPLSEVKSLSKEDITNAMGGLPRSKKHAASLAVEVLQRL